MVSRHAKVRNVVLCFKLAVHWIYYSSPSLAAIFIFPNPLLQVIHTCARWLSPLNRDMSRKSLSGHQIAQVVSELNKEIDAQIRHFVMTS